jgi:hypothetical protein
MNSKTKSQVKLISAVIDTLNKSAEALGFRVEFEHDTN